MLVKSSFLIVYVVGSLPVCARLSFKNFAKVEHTVPMVSDFLCPHYEFIAHSEESNQETFADSDT